MTYVVIAVVVLGVCLLITGLCAWATSKLDTGFFAAIGFFTGVVATIEICLMTFIAIPVIAIFSFHLLDLLHRK